MSELCLCLSLILSVSLSICLSVSVGDGLPLAPTFCSKRQKLSMKLSANDRSKIVSYLAFLSLKAEVFVVHYQQLDHLVVSYIREQMKLMTKINNFFSRLGGDNTSSFEY